MLYQAITHKKGLFAHVNIETHAPQQIFYPGAPVFQSEKSTHHQQDFLEANQLKPEKAPLKILERGTLEHRVWLWIVTARDYRDVSNTVYSTHCHLYQDHPEFYSGKLFMTSYKDFEKILSSGKYKINEPKMTALRWWNCMKIIHQEFDGDPLNLLHYAGWSVESVYAWKHEQKKFRGYDPIPGWGCKLLSLYFLYLAELGHVLPDDAYPADVHGQALAIQTNTLDWKGRDQIYASPYAEMIRKETSALCKEKNWDVLEVAHAKYLLGSVLCTTCSSRKDVPLLCPIYDECRGRAETSNYSGKGRWLRDSKPLSKGGERPKYGIPNDAPKRITTKKNALRIKPVIPIYSLFPKKGDTT